MTSRFDESAKRRIQELIDLGEEVKASFRMTPQRMLLPDSTLYEKWRTSSLNFLATALGKDTVHYNAFVGVDEDYSSSEPKVLHFLGVLHAARDDIQSGWVGRRDLLLTADAFESFLEQAHYLLEQGYKDPAAMLAGAVLESTLRKMCDVHGVPYDPRATMEPLNVALARHAPPVYNKLVQKQITAWADLRNNAAHGRDSEYTKKQVADMLGWVREFAARHLA
jgi:hypothetical protein